MATSKIKIRTLAIGLLCGFGIGTEGASAQIDILTTREALRILDKVPAVSQARTQGECPSYSVVYESPALLLVQVRGACFRADFLGSTLIDNYVVNRKTGAIVTGLEVDSSSRRISTPTIDAIQKELLRIARSRTLSAGEAKCLAFEAIRSFKATEPATSFSVSQIREGPGEFQFAVKHHLPGNQGVAVRFVTVNTETGHVRDDSRGWDIASHTLAQLTSKMISIREVPVVSSDDALAIALHVPSIISTVADSCSELVSNDYGSSEQLYIELRTRCPGSPSRNSIVASVNTQSGQVTDPRTHKSLTTSESERIAREIISQREQELRENKATVKATCMLQER